MGSNSSAPPAPDYKGAAEAQGKANQAANTEATWANRPNVTTPWGGQTWNSRSTTDPTTGQPVTAWNTNISLSPEQQAAQSAQSRLQAGRSSAAEDLLGQAKAGFATPMDWSALPKGAQDSGAETQGAFGRMAALLQPQRAQHQASLETQLSNQGLSRDSEAYKRAMQAESDMNATQDRGLLAQAGAEGRATGAYEAGRRTTGIAEEAQRRGMTLNELNALISGQQVSLPQGVSGAPSPAAGRAGTAPLADAAQNAGQYGVSAAQVNQGNQMDWGSLAGTVAAAAIF